MVSVVGEEVAILIFVIFFYWPLSVVITQLILEERLLRVDTANQLVLILGWLIILQTPASA